MSLLLLILILLILFGGLGFHSNWGYYGAGPFGGLGSLLVLILLDLVSDRGPFLEKGGMTWLL